MGWIFIPAYLLLPIPPNGGRFICNAFKITADDVIYTCLPLFHSARQDFAEHFSHI